MIRVLLAEKSLRQGIGALLTRDAGIDLFASVETADEAVRVLKRGLADVVVVDASFVTASGSAFWEAARRGDATRVVLLLTHPAPASVRRFMRLGAAGIVSKDNLAQDLPIAIRRVRRGQSFLGQDLEHGPRPGSHHPMSLAPNEP